MVVLRLTTMISSLMVVLRLREDPKMFEIMVGLMEHWFVEDHEPYYFLKVWVYICSSSLWSSMVVVEHCLFALLLWKKNSLLLTSYYLICLNINSTWAGLAFIGFVPIDMICYSCVFVYLLSTGAPIKLCIALHVILSYTRCLKFS